MNRVNYRFLGLVIVGALVLVGAVLVAHRVQTRRHAHAYLEKARAARDANNLTEAADLFNRYLDLVPGDAEAGAEFGLLLADTGRYVPAYVRLEGAVRSLPDRIDLRRRLAEVALRIGRFTDATEQIGQIQQIQKRLDPPAPEDATLYAMRAVCEEALGQPMAAVKSLDQAIKVAPDQVETYSALAELLRRVDPTRSLGREKGNLDPDYWIEEMVGKNPSSARSHVLRGRYRQKWKPKEDEHWLENAEKDAAEALRLAPKDPDALLLAAQLRLVKAGGLEKPEQRKAAYGQAREFAERGVESSPGTAAFYIVLAQVELALGEPDESVRRLTKVPENLRENLDLLWYAALIRLDQSQTQMAEDLVGRLKTAVAAQVKLFRDQGREKVLRGQIMLLQARGEYLNGRLAYLRGDYGKAQEALENARVDLTDQPPLLADVNRWLAHCFERIGDGGNQMAAYQAAVRAAPTSSRARMDLAQTLAAAGQLNEAIQQQRIALGLPGAPADGLIQLARWLLQNARQQHDPVSAKDAQSLLEKAAEFLPESIEVPLLRAEILVMQGELPKAEKLVEDLRGKKPKELALWLAQARLAEARAAEARAAQARLDQPPKDKIPEPDWSVAERLLDETEKRFGDTVAVRLARAQYLITRHGKESISQLRKLAENTDRFNDAEKVQLWGQFASALLQWGDAKPAMDLALKAAQKAPGNVPIRLIAFDAAVRAGDSREVADRILKEVKDIKGGEAAWLVATAVQLKLDAQVNRAEQENVAAKLKPAAGPGEKESLQSSLQSLGKARDKLTGEALEKLARAGQLQPTWARVPLLRGEVQDLLGQRDQALASYLEAIDRGERDDALVRRVIELVYTTQNDDARRRLMARLEAQPGVLFPEVSRSADAQPLADFRGMAAAISLRSQDVDRALEIARQGAKESKDYRDHLLLGQVLFEAAKKARLSQRRDDARTLARDAENALREAGRLQPDSWSTWAALIRLLAETGQIPEAEKTLSEAKKTLSEAKQKLSPDELHHGLAACYEALGKLQEAAAELEAALAGNPNDLGLLRQVVRYYDFHGQAAKAQAHLENVLDGRVKIDDLSALPWARRALASLLAQSQRASDLSRALDLVGQNLKSSPDSVDDLRVRAVVLAQDGKTESRKEAVAILENLLSNPRTATPADRFLLAQLQLKAGDWLQFTTTMRALLASGPQQPQYLGVYVDALLRREPPELAEAALWLGQLENLAPNDLGTVRLRARLLFAQGSHDEAIKRLEDFLARLRQAPDHALAVTEVVAILEELAKDLASAGKPAEAAKYAQKAEAAVRQYVEQHPEQGFFLAELLARLGRAEEALQAADKLWPKANPSAIAAFTVQLAGAGSATPQQLNHLEKLLADALQKRGRPLPLLLAMADLYTVQNRFDDVETIYAEILRADPSEVIVLNNWAVLLALRGKNLDQASQMMEKAIQLRGRDPTLLDSRASVLAAQKRPQEALNDLKESIDGAPRPTRYFHLAQVQLQLGNRKQAEDAWKNAKKLGLKPGALHPLERDAFNSLEKEFQ